MVGKWRLAILYALQDGPLRFSELKEQLPGCSVKVLSSVLKDMVYHKLLVRKQYQTIPVKVTYELHSDAKLLVRDLYDFYKASCQYVAKNYDILPIEPKIVEQIRQEVI